jgi:penicillin amidase
MTGGYEAAEAMHRERHVRPRRSVAVTVLSALVLVGALWLGARGAGPLPPLGPLLDPANGAWAAAAHADLPAEVQADIPGLTAPVDIRYDRRGVPHIFASTRVDAIRALGWVVARDRYFQLDLQSRAADGRLTTMVGSVALGLDRQMHRLGLPRAAREKLAALDSASPGGAFVDAYADGVNAWFDAMPQGAVPVEYRLLGVRPERWRAVNSLLLFERMGYVLAYLDVEPDLLEASALVGREAAEALSPAHAIIQEPIQPDGRDAPRLDFRVLPPPGAPDTSSLAVARARDAILTIADADSERRASTSRDWRGRMIDGLVDAASPRIDRLFASNNWAVAPGRTRDGHALLAGDPHLELTLPSIWYEAHLVVPGELDVYGVTIPGAPGIIIGFNRDVAWTFTNTGADVMDFYRETVDDSIAPARYLLDGAWRDVQREVVTYEDQRGRTIETDTLRYTHRGPMLRQRGEWLSMRWTVLEPSNEIGAFANAMHARGVQELLDIFATDYFAPAQNMLAADRSGAIAIRSTGHFPLRPGNGSGMEIRDGSTSASDWTGVWPVSAYPQSFNPAQGYLASANQEPIDPRESPAYLGAEAGFDPWRALRINRLLRADSAMTVERMREFQTDPGSMRAELMLPTVLEAARRRLAAGGDTASLAGALRVLSGWDRRYTRENTGAVLFEELLRELRRNTWDELRSNGRSAAMPSTEILLELMQDSASAWWDDRATGDVRETRDDILATSAAAAYDSVVARHGPPGAGAWRWDRVATAGMRHLLQLPGFSRSDIAIQGGPGTLNPSTGGRFGASWRMVVELGGDDDALHAWATYPGGQSGNPASPRYDDRIALWQNGELAPLLVPRSAADLGADATLARATLLPRSDAASTASDSSSAAPSSADSAHTVPEPHAP